MGVICFKYNNTTEHYHNCEYYCDYNCVLSWVFLIMLCMLFCTCCYVNLRVRNNRRLFYVGDNSDVSDELVVEGTQINKPPDYSSI
jgi:hypothetical protein